MGRRVTACSMCWGLNVGEGPKLVTLPEQDKLKAANEELKRLAPIMIEAAPYYAKIRRATYLALIAEGFTEAEALVLCQKTSL